MLGRAPLNGLSDDVLGLFSSLLAGFVLEALDKVGCVTTRVRFELPEQDLFGFIGGHPRDALELSLLLVDELRVPL